MSNLLRSRICSVDALNTDVLVFRGDSLFKVIRQVHVSPNLNRITYEGVRIDADTYEEVGDLQEFWFNLWETEDTKHKTETYVLLEDAKEWFGGLLLNQLHEVAERDRAEDEVYTDSIVSILLHKYISRDDIHAVIDVWLWETFDIS